MWWFSIKCSVVCLFLTFIINDNTNNNSNINDNDNNNLNMYQREPWTTKNIINLTITSPKTLQYMYLWILISSWSYHQCLSFPPDLIFILFFKTIPSSPVLLLRFQFCFFEVRLANERPSFKRTINSNHFKADSTTDF